LSSEQVYRRAVELGLADEKLPTLATA
jgi:hypothetical protein